MLCGVWGADVFRRNSMMWLTGYWKQFTQQVVTQHVSLQTCDGNFSVDVLGS
jgi:hypothetical protein